MTAALLLLTLVLGITGPENQPSPAKHQPRPNVVVIIADDLGAADLGCTGSTFYDTPNLDRLARDGVRFSEGYAACPVCSPTRAALVTGKYPQRLGITDYIGGNRAGKLLPAPNRDHLALDERTIAEAFVDAGYATAFFGKWHLGGPGFYPDAQGFQLNVAGHERGHPPSYFSPYRIPHLQDGPPGEYLTDRLAAEAVSFIQTHRNQPFLLWLPHYAVHTPLQGKPDLIAHYQQKAATLPTPSSPRFRTEGSRQDRRVQDHPVYAAMIKSLDEAVGRVLDSLDQLGLSENTIVLFTSDNGGLSTSEGSPTSNAPLRAGKGWMYEGGIRVPYLIRYPRVIEAGTILDHPIISTDVFPTLLDLCGLPSEPTHHLDGQSLAPLLRGTGSVPQADLFWHYPHYGNQGGRPSGAVRSANWKLIEWYEDNRVELFDLATDPQENHNLASELPAKVNELRTKLQNWRKSVGAVMPRPNPDLIEGQEPSPLKKSAE